MKLPMVYILTVFAAALIVICGCILLAGTAHATDYADADGLIPRNAANPDGVIVYGIAKDVPAKFGQKIVRCANAWNDLRAYNKAAPRFLRKRNAPDGVRTTLRIYGHVDTTEYGAGYSTHVPGPALDYLHYDLALIRQRDQVREGYASRLACHEEGHSRGHADNPFTISAKAADDTVELQTKHWFYDGVPFRKLPYGSIDRKVNLAQPGYFGYNDPAALSTFSRPEVVIDP